jgi:hypothetical protein
VSLPTDRALTAKLSFGFPGYGHRALDFNLTPARDQSIGFLRLSIYRGVVTLVTDAEQKRGDG